MFGFPNLLFIGIPPLGILPPMFMGIPGRPIMAGFIMAGFIIPFCIMAGFIMAGFIMAGFIIPGFIIMFGMARIPFGICGWSGICKAGVNEGVDVDGFHSGASASGFHSEVVATSLDLPLPAALSSLSVTSCFFLAWEPYHGHFYLDWDLLLGILSLGL